MKRIILSLFTILGVASFAFAQEGKAPASPKATVDGTVGAAKVTITYSQPSAKGRKIMGGLVPFGQVWRTGANEATIIEFDKPVSVEGSSLAAGKYELFTIPTESEWTVIFQKYGKQWGAYSYKESNDVLRVKVKPAKSDSFVETFTIGVGKDQIQLKWENTVVAFVVK